MLLPLLLVSLVLFCREKRPKNQPILLLPPLLRLLGCCCLSLSVDAAVVVGGAAAVGTTLHTVTGMRAAGLTAGVFAARCTEVVISLAFFFLGGVATPVAYFPATLLRRRTPPQIEQPYTMAPIATTPPSCEGG